ncbi:TPA: Ltp family lipoprotein [Enterococcus faecalis]|nr:Ltp family lipoprotein [Enterococcus faecalis]
MHAKNQDLKNKVDEGSSKAKSEFEERAKLPAEFGNALIKAEQYLKSTSFSKQKLYDQLIFEKYSNEAAEYAVNNIKANWDEQALKKAKSYQESMEMSPEAIRDQLTSEHGENFTPDEAEYAIQNLGK